MTRRFGAYEILYELSSGGMGSVLLGRRRGPGAFEQLVAIKTILPQYAQSAAVRAMFLDEAAILARLGHPAVATVHDFGEDGGTLYMVMEYVAGIPFREVAQYRPSPAVAARAIAEACRGLHAAHELRDLSGGVLGVVHRDISPDNLMFGFDGHIKVIDFGIALVKNRQAPVTELGTVKGKPPYMSPEQIKNEALDRRSDVFSLAVVLWEVLTGHALFDGDSIYAVARAVEHQDIRPPSQVLGTPLPVGLDAAVMRALERDLTRRTPSAAAFAEQLEEVIQGAGDETLEAWAARVLEERRAAHRAWLAGVVAGTDARRPVGRSTGAVTALAPIGKAATLVAPSPASPPSPAASPAPSPAAHAPSGAAHAPSPGAHAPSGAAHASSPAAHASSAAAHASSAAADASSAAAHAPPPAADRIAMPRRLAPPLAIAVVILALVAGAMYLVRARHAVAVEAGRDAAVAQAVMGVDAAPDAAGDAAPDAAVDATSDASDDAPADAPSPVDAGRRSRPPIEPPVQPRATAPRDAAPVGFGALTAKHKGDRYLNVLLDGRMLGPTPMFRKQLPAGTHTIELVDPATSAVVVSRAVTVVPDETVTVVEP